MMFFEFTFTPNKNDHPIKGAPSVIGYVQADTPEQAKSEARRQLRESLDPENCMCYRPVRLTEIAKETWMDTLQSKLSTESVDNCTDILREFSSKSDRTGLLSVFKKQPNDKANLPDILTPISGSIEAGADFDGASSVEILNQRLANIRNGESLVIHGLSLQTYHACDGYSGSQILLVHTGGLAALGWYKNAPYDVQGPVALSISAAVRAAILEPVKFAADYIAMGEALLCTDDYHRVQLMRDSALANPILSALLQRGVAGLSVFYRTRSGVLLKVRPDWIGELDGVVYLVHVKATDGSCDFGELVERRGYHIRAAFYNFVVGMVFGIEPEFTFSTISCRKRFGRHLVEVRSLDYEDVLDGGVIAGGIITSLEAMQKDGGSGWMGVVRRPVWARQADRQRRSDGRSMEGADDDV